MSFLFLFSRVSLHKYTHKKPETVLKTATKIGCLIYYTDLGRDERKMEKKNQGQHYFIKYQLTRNEWMNMPNHHLFYLLCCSVDHNCSCWHRSRIDRTWSSCVCGALLRSPLLDASLTLTNPNTTENTSLLTWNHNNSVSCTGKCL